MAGFFSNLFGGGSSEEAAKAGEAMRTAAGASAKADLNKAVGTAGEYYGGAHAYLDPSYDQANKGNMALGDFTGANGAEGLQRANDLFRMSPGFQGGLDEAAKQRVRLASLSGSLGSSGTEQQVSDATGLKLADNWYKYGSALAPYLGAAGSAGANQAGVSVGQGNLYPTAATTTGNWDLGVANANAGSEMDAAKAKEQGAMNLMQSVLGAAKLAGNIMAPGSGALFDLAGGAVAKGAGGFGTGSIGTGKNPWG